jgi:O-antigen chain-terminating methyltransferase
MFLQFLGLQAGFTKNKIIRLQENRELRNRSDASLLEVLIGASPDYALVALKGPEAEITSELLNVFSKNYGLTLNELAHRYDLRFGQIEKLEKRVVDLETATSLLTQEHRRLEEQHIALLNSRSWKLTKPLRLLAAMIKGIKQH